MRLILESWAYLLYCGCLMRFCGFEKVHTAVRRRPTANNPPHVSDTALCHAMDLACVFWLKRVLCLQRSAATTILLRRHGWSAEMVIGAQLLPFQSPRLVMSMHLLHRLSGQGANPTGSPTEHSGTEQRA
ncbi:lasso peptide biosynthesis B2 protein [Granulicella sp. L46]|uniref:lasso peptide biosynthesis B2 protein n=1 Tax=Granulicella sp. L46 TaxID=1641865 RepID=UPI00131B4D9B